MSAPTPFEQRLLRPVLDRLEQGAGRDYTARLDVLEAVAALRGGFSLDKYRTSVPEARVLSVDAAFAIAETVAPALRATPIHPALALTALARPPMLPSAQRRSGAYYTDFRLATFLAAGLGDSAPADAIVDPACGTGVLLVACVLQACKSQAEVDAFLTDKVHGADLSAPALRGARLALASLTANDTAVASLSGRLRQLDSLDSGPKAWADIAPNGFPVVVGNPPWEKLKVSRHEHLKERGVDRHYGAEYPALDQEALLAARAKAARYATDMTDLYELEGGGEADLYKLFLALSFNLAGPGGRIAILVPGGLIRSQGTAALRGYLMDHTSSLRMTVLDNKRRFFAIDTRFKFVAVHAIQAAGEPAGDVSLDHATGSDTAIDVIGSVRIRRNTLRELRPDLTVPEVRSNREWTLYRTMAAAGAQLGEMEVDWPLDIVREVDMTNDRHLFSAAEEAGFVPVVEGRMVHQFRCGHKAYVSGAGRSARWRVAEIGESALVPQFWLDPGRLDPRTSARVAQTRVGFCDITGQTNERTLLAARIPADAVCGNKVPTISFAAHPAPQDAADLWLAVVNSLAFDWLLRRLVTTTVNFFVLRGVPFPSLSTSDPIGKELIALSRQVEAAYRGTAPSTYQEVGEMRARIDALVLCAYGVGSADAAVLLDDFPLLDRGQPALVGEARSSITRDLVLASVAELGGDHDTEAAWRVAAAYERGASAFLPAEAARSLVSIR